VTPGQELTNRDYLLLSYPEGAFTDYSGNLTEEVVSSLNDAGDGFAGLFWRVEAKEFEALSYTPAEELVGSSPFDIVLTFAEGLSLTDSEGTPYFSDGDITITYDDGVDVLIKSVLVADVSADGNELTISQSYTPSPGMIITLNVPAEIFNVGYGNPNAEVTASWQAKLTLPDLVGSYSIAAVSGFSPGEYDEVWAASLELVPGNDTALSITIDAGSGGGVAFLAGFNLDSMSVTIPGGTNAGDLYGYGITDIHSSDAATYVGGDVFGTITGASGFTMDLLGMYLSEYDNGDGSFGSLWDAFSTTWTKSAAKSAVSGSINPAKAARFK